MKFYYRMDLWTVKSELELVAELEKAFEDIINETPEITLFGFGAGPTDKEFPDSADS